MSTLIKVIETPRLILREFKLKDAQRMWELNADPEVIKFTGNEPFESIEAAKEFLRNYTHYCKWGFGRWAVVDKNRDLFIGWCGLKMNEEQLIDIGFRFFRDEWNKGFATEAALACLNYGFDELKINEIIARSSIENKASIRVLEKIGMQFWKKDHCDGIGESVYYRIINPSQHSNQKIKTRLPSC